MDQNSRCQSCGMPLGSGFYGKNEDGSETHEFCKFCFQQGKFVEPQLTLKQMVERSINFMMAELPLGEEKAARLANEVIPRLKRWHGG